MSQHTGKKRKPERRAEEDHVYFDSYSDVTIHEEMIADTVRTNAYRTAIFKNAASISGKAVLDVGAGTGVLSLFCAQAGARKVYAVEASSIADEAVKVVRLNGLEERIHVMRATLESVELPEKVEVIVSEWMGYALLHESMLNSVILARDRWLKPGGLMLPSHADLYIAPIQDLQVESRLGFWSTLKDQLGVDMSSMRDFARRCIMNDSITVSPVEVEDVLSHPCRLAQLDLGTITTQHLQEVGGVFRCRCFGSSSVHALCVWFSVTFPAPDHALVLSTSPFLAQTHWRQAVLYLDEAVEVMQDTEVEGEVRLCPSEQNSRHLCVHLDCVVGGQKQRLKTFSIPDPSLEV